MPKKRKQEPKLNIVVAREFRQVLIDMGYKEPQLGMLMAQAAHETAGFNHALALENNNYAGIKYIKALSRVATPSKDYFVKKEEGGGAYAHFKDMHDFILRWIPYANLNHTKSENHIGTPLDADNLTDYAHRLKLNHYYTDAEANYSNGLERWNTIIREKLQDDNASVHPLSGEHSSCNNSLTLKRPLLPGSTLQVPINYSPQIAVADHTRVAMPFMLPDRIIKNPDNIFDLGGDFMQINTMPTPQAPMINNKVRPSETPKNKVKRKITDLPKVNYGIQPLRISTDQIMRNIFVDYPAIKNKWSKPELFNQDEIIGNMYSAPLLSDPGKLGIESEARIPFDIPTINQVQKAKTTYALPEGSGFASPYNEEWKNSGNSSFFAPFSDRKNGIAGQRVNENSFDPSDNNGGRTVNINLNTPMIGHFTVSTKDTGSGLNDLKHQVEEALLEILNSANAIQ